MDIANHLRKAEEAARRRNFKQAIGLYRQVLSFKPDHGEARSGLHATLTRQAEIKKTSPLLAKIGGSVHLLSIFLGRMSKKPHQIARACEKYLLLDPHNEKMNLLLGESLEQSGFPNAAVAVLDHFGNHDGGNSVALRHAGAIHAKLGAIDKAMECLDKALALDPRDAEAEKLRKNVAAESALSRGGYQTATSSRDLVRDKGQARDLEKAQRIHRTKDELEDEIVKLEKALTQDPQDKRARRDLIEIHKRRETFEAALVVVEAGIQLNPDSADLKDARGDLQILLHQREIKKLESRLAHEDDHARAALREDLAELVQETTDFEVNEYRRRVKERPTELELWYSLGTRLLQSGEIDGAVEALQKSVRDPKRRVDSLTKLSQCFFRKGLFELAEKQLVTALESLSVSSDRAKEALYNLGVIAEKDNRPKDAAAYYGRIYEIDIGYRDVAKKIDSLAGK